MFIGDCCYAIFLVYSKEYKLISLIVRPVCPQSRLHRPILRRKKGSMTILSLIVTAPDFIASVALRREQTPFVDKNLDKYTL